MTSKTDGILVAGGCQGTPAGQIVPNSWADNRESPVSHSWQPDRVALPDLTLPYTRHR